MTVYVKSIGIDMAIAALKSAKSAIELQVMFANRNESNIEIIVSRDALKSINTWINSIELNAFNAREIESSDDEKVAVWVMN